MPVALLCYDTVMCISEQFAGATMSAAQGYVLSSPLPAEAARRLASSVAASLRTASGAAVDLVAVVGARHLSPSMREDHLALDRQDRPGLDSLLARTQVVAEAIERAAPQSRILLETVPCAIQDVSIIQRWDTGSPSLWRYRSTLLYNGAIGRVAAEFGWWVLDADRAVARAGAHGRPFEAIQAAIWGDFLRALEIVEGSDLR